MAQTKPNNERIRVFDLLEEGESNARTARDLAKILNTETRTITAMVEAERREGYPICASCNPRKPGYYKAETPEVLKNYCEQLHHRITELQKTEHALIKIATKNI